MLWSQNNNEDDDDDDDDHDNNNNNNNHNQMSDVDLVCSIPTSWLVLWLHLVSVVGLGCMKLPVAIAGQPVAKSNLLLPAGFRGSAGERNQLTH